MLGRVLYFFFIFYTSEILYARYAPTLDRDHVIATLTSNDLLTSLGDHHVATDTVAFLAPAAALTRVAGQQNTRLHP